MKTRIFLFATLLMFGFGHQASAQCTPDPQYTAQGVYPDTIQNLPHGTVGQAYSTVVTVVVPEDTMVTDPLPLTLDVVDFQLDTIRDMPPGFTYECWPNTCIWPGNSSGCILISGPPLTSPESGIYPLYIKIIAHFTSIIGPITRQGQLPGYEIVIDNTIMPVGVETVDKLGFRLMQNVPNPSIGETMIGFTSVNQVEMELNLYNSMGQVVMTKKVKAERGLNEIILTTSHLAEGMYIYTLNNGNKVLKQRIVVVGK